MEGQQQGGATAPFTPHPHGAPPAQPPQQWLGNVPAGVCPPAGVGGQLLFGGPCHTAFSSHAWACSLASACHTATASACHTATKNVFNGGFRDTLQAQLYVLHYLWSLGTFVTLQFDQIYVYYSQLIDPRLRLNITFYAYIWSLSNKIRNKRQHITQGNTPDLDNNLSIILGFTPAYGRHLLLSMRPPVVSTTRQSHPSLPKLMPRPVKRTGRRIKPRIKVTSPNHTVHIAPHHTELGATPPPRGTPGLRHFYKLKKRPLAFSLSSKKATKEGPRHTALPAVSQAPCSKRCLQRRECRAWKAAVKADTGQVGSAQAMLQPLKTSNKKARNATIFKQYTLQTRLHNPTNNAPPTHPTCTKQTLRHTANFYWTKAQI